MDDTDGYVFTREAEKRMNELNERVSRGASLSFEECDELAQLKKRYHDFLEEGECRLRGVVRGTEGEAVADMDNACTSDSLDAQQNTFEIAKKAAYFWGSLTGTLVLGYICRKAGLTPDFLHWNFITEDLILGALPVVTKLGSSGDHLVQLCDQLKMREKKLGLVVACIEDTEEYGFGLNMVTFADEELWHHSVNSDIEYIRLPMTDTSANISPDVVTYALKRMHACIQEKKCAVYVHCKAGKGRSWMVVMCYLIKYEGMSFEAAEALIQNQRPQINPSMVQRNFAAEFEKSVCLNEQK